MAAEAEVNRAALTPRSCETAAILRVGALGVGVTVRFTRAAMRSAWYYAGRTVMDDGSMS
jgi:hypothetical protein